jgi:hypothetical protein
VNVQLRIVGPTRALSGIGAGDVVRIETILAAPLRSLCADIGLNEGDVVRCRNATLALLLLESPQGHIVALARDRSRLIRVSDIPAA